MVAYVRSASPRLSQEAAVEAWHLLHHQHTPTAELWGLNHPIGISGLVYYNGHESLMRCTVRFARLPVSLVSQGRKHSNPKGFETLNDAQKGTLKMEKASTQKGLKKKSCPRLGQSPEAPGPGRSELAFCHWRNAWRPRAAIFCAWTSVFIAFFGFLHGFVKVLGFRMVPKTSEFGCVNH